MSVRLLPGFLAAIAASLILACAVPAAQPTWLRRDAALAEARRQGKLLLAVHLSCDFTTDAANSPEARLYGDTFREERIQRLLRERYILTLRGVGENSTLQLQRQDKAAAQEGAVAYICLPDERVLHFIPGFLSADELLAELNWAERSYAEWIRLPEAQQPLAARRSHLAAIAKADLPQYRQRFPSRWNDEGLLAGPSTFDLPAAASAARTTFDGVLLGRVAEHWRREQLQNGLAAITAHGSVASELAHFMLSEFPLPALGDLAPSAYAACTGQRMFCMSKRRAELATWWQLAEKAARPKLLVLADDDYYRAAPALFVHRPRNFTTVSGRKARANPAQQAFAQGKQPPDKQIDWPPKDAASLPGWSKLAVQTLTLDELAILLADARLPPVTYARGQPLRYLMFDSRGFLTAIEWGSDEINARLADAVRKATGPQDKIVIPPRAGVQTNVLPNP